MTERRGESAHSRHGRSTCPFSPANPARLTVNAGSDARLDSSANFWPNSLARVASGCSTTTFSSARSG